MKKSILCVVGFAVIAALVCVVCNDSGVNDNDRKGAADAFLDRFLDTAVTYYGLTINQAGGGTVSRNPNEARYRAGDTVTVTAEADSGYEFTGWTGASNDTAASVEIIMNSDLTLMANFIPITTTYYTLDISVLPIGCGSVSRNPDKAAYAAGESVIVTATASPGYAFDGWSGASNNTTTAVTVTMNRDLSLTAHFKDGTYTLTLAARPTSGGSVSPNPDQKTYSYNDGVTVTAEAAAGYRFTGWSGASTSTTDAVKITMNGNKTLTANFIGRYTVTFDANGGSGTLPVAQTVDKDSCITLPNGSILSNADFIVVGWNTNKSGTGNTYSVGEFYMPTDNVTLYAKWNTKYTVTFNTNGGRGTAPAAQTVNDDLYITLPSGSGLSKSGSSFVGWNTNTFGTGTIYSAGESYKFNADVTLYAKYDTKQTVTFNINSGSGTVPAAQTVTFGESITLPDGSGLTRNSYIFGGWNTNNSGTGATYYAGSSYRPVGDVTFYAKWVPSVIAFTDSRDNKVYKKVRIGNQVWMAQNLNSDVPNNETDKCYYDGIDSCARYGRLYYWSTAMGGAKSSSANPSGVRGVCPAGWHIPSDDEWTTLMDYVGDSLTAGTKLKSSQYWNYSQGVPAGTDEYGFSALPGGFGYTMGSTGMGNYGDWWSTTETEDNVNIIWARRMTNGIEYVFRTGASTGYRLSVRCVQD